MRKILLATTALVAAGGVSAASAIDISGSYGVEYYSESNTGGSADAADVSGDDFIDDGLISFSGETTSDNGLTFGGKMTLNHGGAIEDQGLYISGDFGYFMAGATDGVVDGMDNFMTPGSAIPENGATTDNGGTTAGVGLLTNTMIADNPGTEKVGYRSNVISGFQVGATYEDAGQAATNNNDVSGYIVTYDAGFAKIGYANGTTNSTTSNGANTGRSQYGLGTTLGGVTLGLGFGTQKTAGANGAADTSKIDTRGLGLSYSVNDATGLYAVFTSSEEKIGSNAGDKMSSQTFGLTYTIAPGLTSILETASADYTDATAGSGNSDGLNQTTAKIKVSF
ncbi:MAG: porin [Pseudomonadota bacterium]|nr:porin [Pseudomonadota bacterium]